LLFVRVGLGCAAVVVLLAPITRVDNAEVAVLLFALVGKRDAMLKLCQILSPLLGMLD